MLTADSTESAEVYQGLWRFIPFCFRSIIQIKYNFWLSTAADNLYNICAVEGLFIDFIK